jgi:hypothetical protein
MIELLGLLIQTGVVIAVVVLIVKIIQENDGPSPR